MATGTRSRSIEDRVAAVELQQNFFDEQMKLFGERLGKVEQVLGLAVGEDRAGAVADGSKLTLLEGRLKTLEGKVDESLSKSEVCSVRLEEIEQVKIKQKSEWLSVERNKRGRLVASESTSGGPAKIENSQSSPEEALDVVVNPRGTWGHKVRNFKGKFHVVGDSLARGAGFKLRSQLGDFVEVQAVGGAKLSQVHETISQMNADPSKSLVIVAGANNMSNDYGADMISDYAKIIEAAKKVTEKIVVVGLIKRYDLAWKFEAKRKLINERVKSMCAAAGVGFVDFGPLKYMVQKDGLHLNFRGQIGLGQLMHDQCKAFLG